MAVTTENPVASSVANGVTTSFPHSFTVLSADDLVVQGELGDVLTVYDIGADYTITGVGGSSGSVEFLAPPAAGTVITRYRSTQIKRETDYQTNGDLLAETVNKDFDRIWHALRDMNAGTLQSLACLRVPAGESLTTLADAAARDGKLLSFDSEGNPVLVAPASGSATDLAILLADGATPSNGAAMIGVAGGNLTLKNKLRERVSVFDFMTSAQVADVVTYGYATNATSAIIAALASGAKRVHMPAGGYLITSQISIPNYVTLFGDGHGLFAGTGATRIKKRGAFNGVVLNGASQLRNLSVEGDTGNTLDGVHVLGGRSMLDSVSVFSMGRDGIKVGDYALSGANTNLWRITNCIGRSNGRHGCHIAHEGESTAPDANAGIMVGFEATSNGADGLYIGESVDNQIFGLCSQSNTGWGFRLGNHARGNFIALPYTEFNGAGDGGFEVGADRNFLLGFRGGQNNDGWVNNGSSNIIWGRYGSVQDVPLHSAAEAFEDLRILERTTSGVWKLSKQAATRHLLLDLIGSGAGGDVMIQSTGGGPAGLRFSTATHAGALRNLLTRTGVTINFGTVATNSTVDATVTLTGADGDYTFTISATHALPAGVMVDCYWDSAASAVKARASNTTGSGVTVNGTFNISAFKVGS